MYEFESEVSGENAASTKLQVHRKKIAIESGRWAAFLAYFVILAISKPHFILRIYNICYFALICIFYYF